MRFTGFIHQSGAEKLSRTKGTSGLVNTPAWWRKWPWRWWRYRRWRRSGRVCVWQASHVQRADGLAVVRSTTATTTAFDRRAIRTRRSAVPAPSSTGRLGWPPSGKSSCCLTGHGHHSITHGRVQGRYTEERWVPLSILFLFLFFSIILCETIFFSFFYRLHFVLLK